MAISVEEMKDMLKGVEIEAEKNPFTRVVRVISEELSKESETIDVEKVLELIESESGFDDPSLIYGFLAAYDRMPRNIIIKKSFVKGNYI